MFKCVVIIQLFVCFIVGVIEVVCVQQDYWYIVIDVGYFDVVKMIMNLVGWQQGFVVGVGDIKKMEQDWVGVVWYVIDMIFVDVVDFVGIVGDFCYCQLFCVFYKNMYLSEWCIVVNQIVFDGERVNGGENIVVVLVIIYGSCCYVYLGKQIVYIGVRLCGVVDNCYFVGQWIGVVDFVNLLGIR